MAFEENSSAESGSISRRTIVKGAAWAAPVMIAAVAVPAAVASGPTSLSPVDLSFTNLTDATTTFAMSPAPASGTAVSLVLTGPFRFANGTTSTSVTIGSEGTFSVAITPTAIGSGTITASRAGWSMAPIATLHSNSANPPSVAVKSNNSETYVFALAPAIPAGTVNLSVSGAWILESATPASVNGSNQVSVKLKPSGKGKGSLRITRATWGEVVVSLERL